MSKPILTQQYIKELFVYDGKDLRWKIKKAMRIKVGDVAGNINEEGYRHIMIDGYKYLAHRIVWFWFNGEWPVEIDHRNRERGDNRIENLRSANRLINMQNTGISNTNNTGFKGIEYKEKHKFRKWQVSIGGGLADRKIYLGCFETIEEAISMRLTAENSLWL